ncbi:24415_t:CDS:1, partial [Racocetra persica]
LIDISDLDELVDQVNENTVSDGELLIQIFPHLKTKEKCVKFSEFHRKDKGYFYWLSLIFDELLSRIINRLLIYQNRLYEGKDEE